MLKSLCCMRLNTAGVVLGWLGVVGSFVMTIGVSVVLGYSDVIAQRIMESMKDGKQTYDEIHTALIIVCSVYLAIIVLNLLASGLLILGTIKERHLMLLPWLINSGVGLVFNIIYHMFLILATMHSNEFGRIIPVMFVTSLGLGLQIYIYYGIYSLFKQIQLTSEQQRPLINQPQGLAVPNQGNTYPSYTKI